MLDDGLRVSTLAELARIKSWLLVERDTVRDYLDVVAILEALGHPFFWLAALENLGERIDPSRQPRIDDGLAGV